MLISNSLPQHLLPSSCFWYPTISMNLDPDKSLLQNITDLLIAWRLWLRIIGWTSWPNQPRGKFADPRLASVHIDFQRVWIPFEIAAHVTRHNEVSKWYQSCLSWHLTHFLFFFSFFHKCLDHVVFCVACFITKNCKLAQQKLYPSAIWGPMIKLFILTIGCLIKKTAKLIVLTTFGPKVKKKKQVSTRVSHTWIYYFASIKVGWLVRSVSIICKETTKVNHKRKSLYSKEIHFKEQITRLWYQLLGSIIQPKGGKVNRLF